MSDVHDAKKLQTFSEFCIKEKHNQDYERCRSKMISEAQNGLYNTLCYSLNDRHVELLRSEGFDVKQGHEFGGNKNSPPPLSIVSWKKE